jgi:hypothetical protein
VLSLVSRACWARSDWNKHAWNTWDRGLEWIILAWCISPLPLYWTHRAYARLSNNNLKCDIKQDSTFSVLASKNGSNQEIRILTGRHESNHWTSPAPSENVVLTINNYPYLSNGTIPIVIQRIPSQHIYSPLSQPELVLNGNVSVINGTVTIPISNYMDGDAYYIYLNRSQILTAPTEDYSSNNSFETATDWSNRR